MTFVSTKAIYLNLGVFVHYPKSNPYYQGRQFRMIFFSELCPLFDLDILSSIKHPTAERWHPHAVLLLTIVVVLNIGKFDSLHVCLHFPKQALVFTFLHYKSFENTVGKGEIARNEQFLLFPQCFLPICRTFCHLH